MARGKIVIKKTYTAFFGITAVVLLTALITGKCPVCEGTGKVSAAVGMENVHIADFSFDQRYLNSDFCMGYTLYKYELILTLTNNGSEKATGWIKAVLKDFLKGSPLDVQYVGVEVPAATTVRDNFTVWFMTAFDIPPNVTVDAEVEYGGIKCLACDGKGELPLNAWLLGKALKANLQRITRMEQEFRPPAYTTPLPPEGE
jgi:hypothetical protein